MSEDHRIFDRAVLRRRRDRVAAGAGAHDFLLERAADDIADRLALTNRHFAVGVNLGAHHGLLSRRLRTGPDVEFLIDMEASGPLLAACTGPLVCGDEELLPFGGASLDLVVSALSLQFVNDLPGTLAQVRQALKPDGLLIAAMIGGRTLHQLRDSFMRAESELDGGASPRVAPFADVRDLGGLLQRAGFALPVVDSDVLTVTYADPFALMRDLRGMGAGNVLHDRARRPLKRTTLMRAAEIYLERYCLDGGRIPATFEIITLTGWAPHESQQQPLRPGSAKARLADALGSVEHSAGDKAGGGGAG